MAPSDTEFDAVLDRLRQALDAGGPAFFWAATASTFGETAAPGREELRSALERVGDWTDAQFVSAMRSVVREVKAAISPPESDRRAVTSGGGHTSGPVVGLAAAAMGGFQLFSGPVTRGARAKQPSAGDAPASSAWSEEVVARVRPDTRTGELIDRTKKVLAAVEAILAEIELDAYSRGAGELPGDQSRERATAQAAQAAQAAQDVFREFWGQVEEDWRRRWEQWEADAASRFEPALRRLGEALRDARRLDRFDAGRLLWSCLAEGPAARGGPVEAADPATRLQTDAFFQQGLWWGAGSVVTAYAETGPKCRRRPELPAIPGNPDDPLSAVGEAGRACHYLEPGSDLAAWGRAVRAQGQKLAADLRDEYRPDDAMWAGARWAAAEIVSVYTATREVAEEWEAERSAQRPVTAAVRSILRSSPQDAENERGLLPSQIRLALWGDDFGLEVGPDAVGDALGDLLCLGEVAFRVESNGNRRYFLTEQ